MSLQTPPSFLAADNLRAFTASDSKHSLDELVHALSSVLHIHNRTPIQSCISNLQRKHLGLLDAIALLLMVDDKTAVAVSSLENRTSIKFYFAKNYPCTTDITEYVESLLEEIRNYEPSKRNRFAQNILKKVASRCLKKISNRIRKVSAELARSRVKLEMLSDVESINNLGIWRSTGVPEGATAKAFAKAYSRVKSPLQAEQLDRRDKALLALYFRFALRMNTSIEELRGDPHGVLELLTLSYYISCALIKDPILRNTALIGRIQRLGDYYGAVRTITRALGDPVVLRKEIHFIEIKPPPPVEHFMPKNFLSIINSYADFTRSCGTTWNELSRAYSIGKEPTEGQLKVTANVHCECTIATYMVEKFREQGKRATCINIGISKYSCWFCEKYLEFLTQSESGVITDMKVAVSRYRYRAKIQAGWSAPPNGPPNVLCKMGALLGREIEAILKTTEGLHRTNNLIGYDSDDDY
ncbi:hypothetical protein V8E54_009409 [Elaphomyces granulatus]